MLEAAKKTDNPDLTEYRGAVEQWLKAHPLPENPSSAPLTPAEATSPSSRQIYVIGLLYLNNHKLDLSPEALQVYQNCSSLHPEEHLWKVTQAFYHISKLQWSEAEHLLADLPKDDPAVINAQRYLKVSHARDQISKLQWVEAKQLLADLPKDDDSVRDTQRELDYHLKERGFSLITDVVLPVLSKFMPSSYREKAAVDISFTALHFSISEIVRQMRISRLLGIPDRAISFNPLLLPLSSRIYMVGDIVDCVFRNLPCLRPLQSYKNLTSYTLRAGHAAWTLKDPLLTACKLGNPLQLPLIPVMNLGNLLISTTQSFHTYRETRRPASTQAFLSTLQVMASDISLGAALQSHSNFFPWALSWIPQIGSFSIAKSLSVRTISAPRLEGKGNSKNTWILGAVVIGAVASFRFYHDYPHLWAASIMRDIEFYSHQGKEEEVQRVLTESENSYFVSSVRPAVRNYALYANGLKDYPGCLEDPARCQTFLKHLKLILNTLKESKASHHYRDIRNNLLLKKIDIAIKKQDPDMLIEFFNEGPEEKIVIFGFHSFLNTTFYLALRAPDAAFTLIGRMEPGFPVRFHPVTKSFLNLLKAQSAALQDLSQLKLITLIQQPPSLEKAKFWNDALQELQSFFYKNAEKIEAYQQLQFYKLMISFTQTSNHAQTEALFEESDVEIHQRFSHMLILCTRLLWKAGRYERCNHYAQ